MDCRPPDPRLLGFLAAYDRHIANLALALREMVLEVAPESIESIYDAYSAVSIGYSFTGRLSDTFLHIATYAHHVNLGFNRGASLADPIGVLKGTGKLIRHIRITGESDLAAPFLPRYIHAAIVLAGNCPPTPLPGPKSVVRGNYPTKRRPSAARIESQR